MKPFDSLGTTKINEIRTERLSLALQKMRKKSISVCAMRDMVKVNIEKVPTPENSPRKRASFEEEFSSKSDDTAARLSFRPRTSSAPAMKEFTLQPLVFEGKEPETAPKVPTIVSSTVGAAFNRFVKQLFRRRDKDCQSATSRPIAMNTISDQPRPKDKLAVSMRFRSQTSVQPAPISGNRSSSHYTRYHGSCSKSSSGVSSRCHSPMRFSALLGLPSSEPVSPGGTLSPLMPENSFTVLVVGSEGAGKRALTELFLQSYARKAPASLELGSDVGDFKTVTLVVDNEDIHLRFIEVNNEKNDLWLSLSAAAHIVVYNFDDANSFRNATEVVNKLRECSDHIPIVLVSNNASCEHRRANANSDDWRHIAKQSNCKFFEVNLASFPNRAVQELLVTLVHQIRRRSQSHHGFSGKRDHSTESTLVVADAGSLDQPNGTFGGGFFRLRTWSACSNSSSAGSKASPTFSLIRQTFWKTKARCGVGKKLGSSYANLTLSGLQKYFTFTSRRSSLSLENLDVKKAI